MPKQFFLLGLGLALVIAIFLLDLSTGSLIIDFPTVWSSLWGNRSTDLHQVVSAIRVPRAFIALFVGAGLAAAGACMQALTRNPLASPEILGVNNGAALAIVIGYFLVPGSSVWIYQIFAVAGAACAGSFIFVLSSIGGKPMTPLKLIVAGTAVSLLLASFTQGVLVLNEKSIDEVRFWLAGSVAGKELQDLIYGGPLIIVGLLIALALGSRMNALQLGDEVAVGIGSDTPLTKKILFFVTVLLSAGCVTIAGPIAFVGLAVPHIVRSIAGADYRWIVVHSILMGSALLMLADIAAKLVIHPDEVSAGVMTVMMGAPFFIYLARKKEWRL
ncbi:putative siderophore transport system permease protein YfiZ precursor [compost metagenome]